MGLSIYPEKFHLSYGSFNELREALALEEGIEVDRKETCEESTPLGRIGVLVRDPCPRRPPPTPSPLASGSASDEAGPAATSPDLRRKSMPDELQVDLAALRGMALVRAEATMNLLLADIRELTPAVDGVLTWPRPTVSPTSPRSPEPAAFGTSGGE